MASSLKMGNFDFQCQILKCFSQKHVLIKKSNVNIFVDCAVLLLVPFTKVKFENLYCVQNGPKFCFIPKDIKESFETLQFLHK